MGEVPTTVLLLSHPLAARTRPQMGWQTTEGTPKSRGSIVHTKPIVSTHIALNHSVLTVPTDGTCLVRSLG